MTFHTVDMKIYATKRAVALCALQLYIDQIYFTSGLKFSNNVCTNQFKNEKSYKRNANILLFKIMRFFTRAFVVVLFFPPLLFYTYIVRRTHLNSHIIFYDDCIKKTNVLHIFSFVENINVNCI